MTDPETMRLITAYWCFAESDKHNRFEWASEEVDQLVQRHINDKSRNLLIMLAQSAPDEEAGAYLAAGPLEDYIGLVIKKKHVKEAKKILASPDLKKLLPYVWGRVEELEPLATGEIKQGKRK